MYLETIVYVQLGKWRIVGIESDYSDVLAFQFNKGTDEISDWNQMGVPFIILKNNYPILDTIYSIGLNFGTSLVRFDGNRDFFRVRGIGQGIEFCNIYSKDWIFSSDIIYTTDLELFHRSDLANITSEDINESNFIIVTAIARHDNNRVHKCGVVRFPTYMSILSIPEGY